MPLQYSILIYGCDMGDKDNNGWNEHKRAVYQRFDTIDKTNEMQNVKLDDMTKAVNNMCVELGKFKTNVKWTVTIVTIVISSIIGTAIRLIAG